jgi:hypothetical protein
MNAIGASARITFSAIVEGYILPYNSYVTAADEMPLDRPLRVIVLR